VSESSERQRSLDFLRQTIVLTLEGHERAADDLASAPRVPLPRHAAAMLGRLFGHVADRDPVKELKLDLSATRDKPLLITRLHRLYHLLLSFLLLELGAILFVPTLHFLRGLLEPVTGSMPAFLQFPLFLLLTLSAFSFFSQGGLGFAILRLF